MPSGTPNQNIPNRGASEYDEENEKTDTHPTGSHQEHEVVEQDISEILELEPMAMQLLGRDLIVEIIRTGRGLGEGEGAATSAFHAASDGAAISTYISSTVTAHHGSDTSRVSHALPAHQGESAIHVTSTVTNHQGMNSSQDSHGVPAHQGNNETHISPAVRAHHGNNTSRVSHAVPVHQGNREARITSRVSHAVPVHQGNSEARISSAVRTYPGINATLHMPERRNEVQPARYDHARTSASLALARPTNTGITAHAPRQTALQSVAYPHLANNHSSNTGMARLANHQTALSVAYRGDPRLANNHSAGPSDTGNARLANPQTALSVAYRGDPRLVENYSANINPAQSTSLFIKDLPTTVNIHSILGRIRKTGKVYSIHLNPPTPPHTGCAAKICFFTREAAALFYNNTRCGFHIDGHYATVVWNRVLVPEHVGGWWDEASRVIIVRGPKGVVTIEAIANIVHREIRLYDLLMVCETDYSGLAHGFMEVEVHFGSFRAQAHSAFIVLNRALRGKGVRISYGIDPCA